MSPDSVRRVNISNNLMAINASNPVSEGGINPTIENEEKYCLTKLMQDWNFRNTESFPQSWGISTVEDEKLLFSYTGDNGFQITRSILVNKNMNVEVSS